MQLNLIQGATNAMALINQITSKYDAEVAQSAKASPNLSVSPAQVNRSYEISKDPPITVLKYTNAVTKQVELQIPSEMSIQIYKETQRFIALQEPLTKKINIAV